MCRNDVVWRQIGCCVILKRLPPLPSTIPIPEPQVPGPRQIPHQDVNARLKVGLEFELVKYRLRTMKEDPRALETLFCQGSLGTSNGHKKSLSKFLPVAR